MIKCPNCKAELLIEHSFCPACAFDLRIRKNSVLSEDDVVSKKVPEITVAPELTPPPIPESDIQPEVNLSDSESQKQGMFSKPFSFDGRIRRTEYGISLIIILIIYTIINAIIATGEAPIIGIALMPLIWFYFAQGAKRCHDLGQSGLYQIIPFYSFWMIFAKGEAGKNKYGRNPKG